MSDAIEEQVMTLLSRRPMNLPELISGTQAHPQEVEGLMNILVDKGRVEVTSSNDWKIIRQDSDVVA